MWLTGEFVDVMAPLWRLHDNNRQMLNDLATDGPIVNRTVAWIVQELHAELVEASPKLTTTLASAHRGVAEGHEGLLFIDPNAQNPIFGGFPAIYGEEVHETGAFGGLGKPKPWWRETVEDKGDQILAAGLLLLEADIETAWKQ
ncbi:MAG: hypothetical protein KC441_01510 [Anaerolineales bacterium]|nr:hypothetical protein [Anaerolineales bacterium]